MIEVKVPALSESVSEATLVAWHKREGEPVSRGENLIDIETDKVVLELPAPQGGVLARIVKQDGATVAAGELIALIDTEAPVPPPAPQDVPPPSTRIAPEPALSPSVRKLVGEHHIDPRQLEGSGRAGRITKEDVLAHLEQARRDEKVPPMPPLLSPVAARPEQRVPMTRLRARGAERLVEAQHSAAILTTFNEVNMQPVMDLRSRHKEGFEKQHGVKLGFMSPCCFSKPSL